MALVRAGLVVLTFGNASAVDREAGVIAIKPSGVAYDELTPADDRPSSTSRAARSWTADRGPRRTRRPTSSSTARCSSVGGVVHTHSSFATAWAQAGGRSRCFGTTHADHFDGPVPVTRAAHRGGDRRRLRAGDGRR